MILEKTSNLHCWVQYLSFVHRNFSNQILFRPTLLTVTSNGTFVCESSSVLKCSMGIRKMLVQTSADPLPGLWIQGRYKFWGDHHVKNQIKHKAPSTKALS